MPLTFTKIYFIVLYVVLFNFVSINIFNVNKIS